MEKPKGFVPFSAFKRNLMQNAGASVPSETEQEIDFERKWEESQQRAKDLELQIQELQKDKRHLVQENAQREKAVQELLRNVDSSIEVWKKEMKAHCSGVFEGLLRILMSDPRFQRASCISALEKAMVELSDQKNLVVEVPQAQLALAQKLFQLKPTWRVIAAQEGQLGARFQSEQLQWDSRLDEVVEQMLQDIATWAQE